MAKEEGIALTVIDEVCVIEAVSLDNGVLLSFEARSTTSVEGIIMYQAGLVVIVGNLSPPVASRGIETIKGSSPSGLLPFIFVISMSVSRLWEELCHFLT